MVIMYLTIKIRIHIYNICALNYNLNQHKLYYNLSYVIIYNVSCISHLTHLHTDTFQALIQMSDGPSAKAGLLVS